jgi:hypothetical protein
MAVVAADDGVDGAIGERQHRQLAQQVVESRVGELDEQPLELVHGRLEDDDLREAVEALQRATRGLRPEHRHDADHFWWK